MHAITSLIHDYGVLAVAVVVALECVGLPVPGETALLAAAMYAGTTHDLNIFSVLITAAASAIIGRMVGYFISWEFHWLLIRYGGYIRMTEARIKLGQYLFLEHGGKVVVVAQFVPILRTIAGLLAGVNMMPWRRFVATNVLGACVWAASYGYAAYTFGHQFRRLEASAMVVVGIITAAIIVFGVVFIRRHETQLIAKAQAALPGPLDVPQRSQRSADLAVLFRNAIGLPRSAVNVELAPNDDYTADIAQSRKIAQNRTLGPIDIAGLPLGPGPNINAPKPVKLSRL
jgi:membrane protein DedA with SNARE-associated domain